MTVMQVLFLVWVFLVAPAMITAVWWGPKLKDRIKLRREEKIGFTDPSARLVVRVLKTEPNAWSMPDPYHLRHADGIEVKHPDCESIMTWYIPGLGWSAESRYDDYNRREIRKAIAFWKTYKAESAFRDLKIKP